MNTSIEQFFERVWLGNTYERWGIALTVAIVATVAMVIARKIVAMRLATLAARTETDLDDLVLDIVKRTRGFFLLVIAIALASHFLTLEPGIEQLLRQYVVTVVALLQAGLWGRGLVKFGVQRLVRSRASDDPARTMGASILGIIGQVLVWVTVGLLVLQNCGVQVTPLITGLGVGGIAVALALQSVLGDLFASITILLDKPFVVGDSITLGEFQGTVERIGIKTTRLRSINGEEIVMGNADLVNSRIRNFKRLSERRNLFTIGVTYSTTSAQLAAIPKSLREIIERVPNTRFERAHFKSFGDFALIFEVVYHVGRNDYQSYMDAQQAINFEIFRRFGAEGIEFAFPTQTVHYVGNPADAQGDTPGLEPAPAD
jgi:small-conductance mechanosensitive channel